MKYDGERPQRELGTEIPTGFGGGRKKGPPTASPFSLISGGIEKWEKL
jgi:hypothetical protein